MNAGRILFGSLVAAVGVVFILDSAGVVSAGDVIGSWWPVAIVALGVFHVLGARPPGELDHPRARWCRAACSDDRCLRFPCLALRVADGSGSRRTVDSPRLGEAVRSRPSDDDEVDGIAVLGSARLATRSQSFRRASVTSILGGVTLDLTEALPVAGGATVSITTLLGGVSVLVPRGWLVEIGVCH